MTFTYIGFPVLIKLPVTPLSTKKYLDTGADYKNFEDMPIKKKVLFSASDDSGEGTLLNTSDTVLNNLSFLD